MDKIPQSSHSDIWTKQYMTGEKNLQRLVSMNLMYQQVGFVDSV